MHEFSKSNKETKNYLSPDSISMIHHIQKKKKKKTETLLKLFPTPPRKYLHILSPNFLFIYPCIYIFSLLNSLTKQDVHELHFIFVYLFPPHCSPFSPFYSPPPPYPTKCLRKMLDFYRSTPLSGGKWFQKVKRLKAWAKARLKALGHL